MALVGFGSLAALAVLAAVFIATVFFGDPGPDAGADAEEPQDAPDDADIDAAFQTHGVHFV